MTSTSVKKLTCKSGKRKPTRMSWSWVGKLATLVLRKTTGTSKNQLIRSAESLRKSRKRRMQSAKLSTRSRLKLTSLLRRFSTIRTWTRGQSRKLSRK